MKRTKYEKTLKQILDDPKGPYAQELYNRMTSVRGVIRTSPDGNEFMQIVDVDYTLEGIMVYVQ